MADGAFARELVLAVLLQALDHHEGERRVDRTPEPGPSLGELFLVCRERRERVLGAERLLVRQVRDQLLRALLVRQLGQERPEPRDRLHPHRLLLPVEVVVEAVPVVPHEVVDPGLQREVVSFVPETHFLVVQDVAELGHVQRVDRLLCVEIDQVVGVLPGRVPHHRGADRHRVEPGLVAEGGLEPLVVLLQGRHDVPDPLLVPDLVVDVVLGPREQRRLDRFGVVLGEHGLAVLHRVLSADGAVRLLLPVEVVQLRGRGVDPVAVHQEERGEDRVELDDGLAVRVVEETRLELALGAGLADEVRRPRPRLVVDVDEALIVEVDGRELALGGRGAG